MNFWLTFKKKYVREDLSERFDYIGVRTNEYIPQKQQRLVLYILMNNVLMVR